MGRIIETGDPNPHITIRANDEPGLYGASSSYLISTECQKPQHMAIRFQNGPIQEVGVNGIDNESLLAIVVDRLKGFQTGRLPCRENAIALQHLETALMWLNRRTQARRQRGVEGKDHAHE